MKISIYLCMFLLLLTMVNAANYGLKFDKSHITNNITTGDSSLGYYIFYTEIVNETQIIIDKYENTTYNITIHDYITNKLNNSITVGTTSLIPNGSIEMQTVGLISLYDIGQVTPFAYLKVVDIPPLNVMLIENNYEFDFNFTPTIYNISSNNIVVNITTNYSFMTTPQFYNLPINITTNLKSYVDYINFTLSPLEKFSIKAVNCSSELPINTHGLFCVLNITNEGNDVTSINFKLDKYEKDFNIVQDVGLFVKSSKLVNLYYDVVDVTHTTNDWVVLNVTGKKYYTSINLSTNFTDRIFPYTQNFSISDLEAMKSYRFDFRIIENLNLSQATARFFKKSDNNYVSYKDVSIINVNYDRYFFNVTIEDVGEYKMEMILKDLSTNINVTEYFFKVNQLNSIIYDININFKKIKYGNYITSPFLYIQQDIPINISLISLDYSINGSWSVRVFNNNNNREFYMNTVNQYFTIDTGGNWSIGFMGSGVGNYNGVLRIDTPSYQKSVSNIVFSGQIINYSIPARIDDSQWAGEGKLSCYVEDTGDISTSKYVCNVIYPLESQEINNEILPMTKGAVANIEEKYNAIIDNLKDKNLFKWGVIIVELITLLLVSGYAIFAVTLYPRLNFKIR